MSPVVTNGSYLRCRCTDNCKHFHASHAIKQLLIHTISHSPGRQYLAVIFIFIKCAENSAKLYIITPSVCSNSLPHNIKLSHNFARTLYDYLIPQVTIYSDSASHTCKHTQPSMVVDTSAQESASGTYPQQTNQCYTTQ
jgi:hypothetical protein